MTQQVSENVDLQALWVMLKQQKQKLDEMCELAGATWEEVQHFGVKALSVLSSTWSIRISDALQLSAQLTHRSRTHDL
eukprot:2684513-Amphidinium_carterae.1